jgi:pimeloyl-ACP methyl ester carboxylesterase
MKISWGTLSASMLAAKGTCDARSSAPSAQAAAADVFGPSFVPHFWYGDENPVARGLRQVLIPGAYDRIPEGQYFSPDRSFSLPSALGSVNCGFFFSDTPPENAHRLIILVSGNKTPLASTSYSRTLSALGRVLAFDMPGYGTTGRGRSSPPVGGAQHFEASLQAFMIRVVAYAREELGVAEKHLVFAGTSMGSVAATMGFSQAPESSLLLMVPLLNVAELLPTAIGKAVRRALSLSDPGTRAFDAWERDRAGETPASWNDRASRLGADVGFAVSQAPFKLWSASYGRALGHLLRSMAFPAGITSPALPDYETVGMDPYALLRRTAALGQHTGKAMFIAAQFDTLMGPEYVTKLADCLLGSNVQTRTLMIPGGDHRSKPQPKDSVSSELLDRFPPETRAARQEAEEAAWNQLSSWITTLPGPDA